MSVIGLEKTLSNELAPAVRSNAVLPAPHETARQRELIQDAVSAEVERVGTADTDVVGDESN